MYLKTIALPLLFILAACCEITAQTATGQSKMEKIVVRGCNNYPPFEFINKQGKPDGFNVDLFEAVMRTINVPYDLQLGEWDEVVEAMHHDSIDAIVGMIYSKERAQQVRFCLPHCDISRNIICRKSEPYQTLESLKGKEIIVQTGGWFHKYIIKQNLTDKLIEVDDMREGLILLASGKHDAAIGSDLVALYNIKQESLDNLQIFPTDIQVQQYSIVVSHNNEILLRLINMGLQQLKVSGEYDQIYNKWFGVYGGITPISNTFYYSISTVLLLLLLCLGIVYILRVRIRNATHKMNILNNDLQLTLRAGEVSAWIYDIDKQIFRSLHGTTCAGSGIIFDEFMQKTHPEDAPLFRDSIKRLSSGLAQTDALIIRYPNNEGGYNAYESEMIVEKNTKGQIKFIIGSQKDITLKQKMRVERKEVSLALKMAVKATSLYVWHYHIAEDCFYELKEDKFIKTAHNGSSIKNMIHSEDIASYDHTLTTLLSGKEESLEIVLRMADSGTDLYHYFESCFSTIRDDHNNIYKIAINMRDSTKKWLVRLEMESAYKSLNMAMDVAGLVAWEYNLYTQKYRIVYGNLFYQKDSTPNLDFLHPEDREPYQEATYKIARGESEKEVITVRIKKDDDSYGYFESSMSSLKNDNGVIVSLIGTLKDVSLRKQTELSIIKTTQQMEAINRKNELILNNTNAGLAFIQPDYVVEWENISICSASLSYEAYKQGEKCYVSAHKRTTPCEDCVFQRVMKSRQVERIEFSLDNGHYIEVFATPVINKDQSIDGIVIRVDDITERKQIFLELAQAKEKAEASDKLKSAFLANMSHEIRTPLNAIVGFSELILSAETEEARDEYARIVKKNNELLLQIIGDIVELSKIEAGYIKVDLVQGDIVTCFHDLAKSIEPRIPEGVELICESPFEQCIIDFDINRFNQVISNFLNNAIKFTTKGRITMGYKQVDRGLYFYVSDTGIGIAKKNIERVFARFEKVDDFAQGTGLGMTICKAIIERLGGKIGVESVEGEGSTFWCFIPCEPLVTPSRELSSSQEQQSTPTIDIRKKGHSDQPSILVAEDNPSNFMLISSILKRHFHITHAENGAIAVEMLQSNHYDAILMDMKMPILNGLEATRKIREFDSSTPIIAVTAHAFDSDREAALQAGCNDYLTKPIKQDILFETLRKYC